MKLKINLKKFVCFFLSLLLILGGCLLYSPISYAMTDQDWYNLLNYNGDSVAESSYYAMRSLLVNFATSPTETINATLNQIKYASENAGNSQNLGYNMRFNVGQYKGYKLSLSETSFRDSSMSLQPGQSVYFAWTFNYADNTDFGGMYHLSMPYYSNTSQGSVLDEFKGLSISYNNLASDFRQYEGVVFHVSAYQSTAAFLTNFTPYYTNESCIYYFKYTAGENGSMVYSSSYAIPRPQMNYFEPSSITFQLRESLMQYYETVTGRDYRVNVIHSMNNIYSSMSSFDNYLTTMNQHLALIQDSSRLSENYLADLKYMYADDDMVARKQAGQATEDAALDAFSGQGSAAASESDVGSMKDISGSLRNGLTTGANATAVFGVLNNINVLWVWFTPENLLMINEPHSMPQNTRKSVPKYDNDVVDFYSENQQQLQDLLDFYNKGDSK